MRTGMFIRLAAAWAALAVSISCGDVVRSSDSPTMLSIDSIRPSGTFASTLMSDVITEGTMNRDIARATVSAIMKNVTVAPTTNNDVTLKRYHVTYRRSDGRNVEGVDVPFAFDGAVTSTIPAGGSATFDFEIVRPLAKAEAPLIQLRSGTTALSTIAEVTFFGTDQTGNDLSVTGSVLIEFANFSDS
jgi:hypothetical protein